MKVVLTFDLDDTKDAYDYKWASKATDLRETLDVALQELRLQWKHGDHEVLNDYAGRISEIIYCELGNRNIQMYD